MVRKHYFHAKIGRGCLICLDIKKLHNSERNKNINNILNLYIENEVMLSDSDQDSFLLHKIKPYLSDIFYR